MKYKKLRDKIFLANALIIEENNYHNLIINKPYNCNKYDKTARRITASYEKLINEVCDEIIGKSDIN